LEKCEGKNAKKAKKNLFFDKESIYVSVGAEEFVLKK